MQTIFETWRALSSTPYALPYVFYQLQQSLPPQPHLINTLISFQPRPTFNPQLFRIQNLTSDDEYLKVKFLVSATAILATFFWLYTTFVYERMIYSWFFIVLISPFSCLCVFPHFFPSLPFFFSLLPPSFLILIRTVEMTYCEWVRILLAKLRRTRARAHDIMIKYYVRERAQISIKFFVGELITRAPSTPVPLRTYQNIHFTLFLFFFFFGKKRARITF